MCFKLIVTAVAVTATSGAIAQEGRHEKNGLPCVAELCLGDGMQEISKIQWERARNMFSTPEKPVYISGHKVRDDDLKRLEQQYKGDFKQAAPFLIMSEFDSTALPALSRITAACVSNRMTGKYKTLSGNPTRVQIALKPKPGNTSQQEWTVVTISRELPSAVSDEQKTEVKSELASRYKAFSMGKAKPGGAIFSMSDAFSAFGFHLTMVSGLDENSNQTLHPACGGKSKVKID